MSEACRERRKVSSRSHPLEAPGALHVRAAAAFADAAAGKMLRDGKPDAWIVHGWGEISARELVQLIEMDWLARWKLGVKVLIVSGLSLSCQS